MTGPQFLQQVINGIQLGSIYALIALGYTMVYGVLRLINFAHGDVFMVGAYVGFYAARAMKLEEQPTLGGALLKLAPVLLLAMAACAVLGLVIERLAYRPLRRSPRLTALITAIGVSLFLENAGQLVFGVDPKFFPSITPQGPQATIQAGGVTISKDQLVLVVASALLMGVLWYIVQRTRIGKAMRAVSLDADAAALMGINTDKVISFTFALGAALAGAGGVLFAALTYAKILPLMGITVGLKAFVAAVVGGIGSIPGAMLGGLLMGLSESFVKGAHRVGAFEPSRWTDAVAFVLLIVVLLLRPAGLLGRFAPEKV
jgi:branched-chain amino acid transport system permease protein